MHAAAAGAVTKFSAQMTGENLLQYKLIHVHCTKKSTLVPVSPVPVNKVFLFFPVIDRGKLLQYKLIHIPIVLKKNT